MINKKVAISLFLIILTINFSVGKINNILIETNKYLDDSKMKYNDYNNPIMKSNNYSITATMEPVVRLIRASNESDKEEIEAIDKVLDVKFISRNSRRASGEKFFWTEGVVRDYTDEEYRNYLKAYLKLAFKYPKTVFEGMWEIFGKAGNGMGEDGKQTTRNMLSGKDTLKLFELTYKPCIKWNAVYSRVPKYKMPINLEVRNNVICFLGGVDSELNVTIIHNIFWNLFIPFTLIVISLIYKLMEKDWFMVFLIFAVVARIPLVFVTAPAPYFMYYLSTYLCSYVVSTIVIFEFIINLINKKSKNNKLLTTGENFYEEHF